MAVTRTDGETYVRRSILRAVFRETLNELIDAEIQLDDRAEAELNAMRRRLEEKFDLMLPTCN